MTARTSNWLWHMATAVIGVIGAAILYRYTLGSWMSIDYVAGVLAGSAISAYILGDKP